MGLQFPRLYIYTYPESQICFLSCLVNGSPWVFTSNPGTSNHTSNSVYLNFPPTKPATGLAFLFATDGLLSSVWLAQLIRLLRLFLLQPTCPVLVESLWWNSNLTQCSYLKPSVTLSFRTKSKILGMEYKHLPSLAFACLLGILSHRTGLVNLLLQPRRWFWCLESSLFFLALCLWKVLSFVWKTLFILAKTTHQSSSSSHGTLLEVLSRTAPARFSFCSLFGGLPGDPA